MTEEQAKLTRCCGPEGCGAPRQEDIDAIKRSREPRTTDAELLSALALLPRYCIGSACMGWRAISKTTQIGGRDFPSLEPSDRGYCGLAGPQ